MTRALGILAFVALATTVVLGLAVTPQDVVQGQYVRLIYIHPPLAWTAYLAFGITALSSAMYLWRRTRSRVWDLIAGSSAEVGVVFTGLTLATGSIWGRPTWGQWWTWDARLTSTALLFALFLGYLALRRVPADITVRSRRSAIAALIAFADVPIVHFSVEWWQTLHQGRTLLRPDPQIDGLQAGTLLLGFVAMTLTYAWLVVHRFRVEQLEEAYENEALDLAIAERHAEGAPNRETVLA